jgi:hypothetical protein
MANLIRKAKIHKPIDTRMRSSGEVIISGKEFYTRRKDIAKIVSIPEIFITKIEKHASLEFTTNSTTLVQSAKPIITSPCQPSIAVENQAESLYVQSTERQQHPAATPLPLLTQL